MRRCCWSLSNCWCQPCGLYTVAVYTQCAVVPAGAVLHRLLEPLASLCVPRINGIAAVSGYRQTAGANSCKQPVQIAKAEMQPQFSYYYFRRLCNIMIYGEPLIGKTFAARPASARPGTGPTWPQWRSWPSRPRPVNIPPSRAHPSCRLCR